MIKWIQQVANWKKLNVNKVSESFDTCRRMCTMMLDEIEQLAVDLFMIYQIVEVVSFLLGLVRN